MSDQPHPLWSLHLFGLADRRLDLVLTVLLLVVVVASRAIAFPATIWEQDEAVFAASVLDFDATDNRPHPPWFPLWIGMGKLVHSLGVGPARALQLVSFVFSVWILFPLTAMWSPVVGRRPAVGATVLFLVAPGPWFFSGRAFCGTTATALLVAALALWLQAENRPDWLTAGSIFGSLAVLVRPQFAPAIIGVSLMIGGRIPVRQRRRLFATLMIPLGLGVLALIIAAGGVAPLWSAVEIHSDYHFSRLDEAVHGFAGSGLSRSLGHPALAVAWLVLFHIGMIRVVRQGRWKGISPILIGALLPLMVVIYGLSNPAHARYALPILALTCGLVALGLERVFRKWFGIALVGSVLVAAWLIGPTMVAYRSAVSPPIAALDAAFAEATARRGVVVADRTLHSFFTLRRLERPSATLVLFDHMLKLGHVPPPPPEEAVFVFDAGHGDLLTSGQNQTQFSCAIPLVSTLAQDRYLELTVASGATLRGNASARDPLTLID